MRRTVTILSVIMAAGMGFFIQKKLRQNLFSPDSITIDYKHIYSAAVRRDIDSFARDYLSSSDYFDFKLHAFYEKLKERFKIVKSISWNWGALDNFMITVEGVKPSFKVNDELIFGNKKRLFPNDLFLTASLDDLHCLYLPEKKNYDVEGKKLPANICAFLKSVPDEYLNNYTVHYVGDNHVVLDKKRKSRRDLHCRLLVKDETFASPQGRDKMDFIELVHHDFVSKKPYLKQRWCKNRCVEYDLRFSNRIYAKVIRI